MKNQRLDDFKKTYLNVPIPDELDTVVKKALFQQRPQDELTELSTKNRTGRKNIMNKTKVLRWVGVIAASFALFTATLNISPSFAQTMANVPGVGNVVKVLTFNGFTVKEENFQADLKVPVIDGLEDKGLEAALNAKYLEENKILYENFMTDISQLKEKYPDAHMGMDTGYEVKTDNDQIFSIGRYIVNTVGSSSTVIKYDTIDKKNQVLITLPSLFKNEQYIAVISENILQQMREQMKSDKGIYWIDGSGMKSTGPNDFFQKIAKDQSFYINPDGKLVISFDKYEVAPGYMGVVEFIIPTEILTAHLVSSAYLK